MIAWVAFLINHRGITAAHAQKGSRPEPLMKDEVDELVQLVTVFHPIPSVLPLAGWRVVVHWHRCTCLFGTRRWLTSGPRVI